MHYKILQKWNIYIIAMGNITMSGADVLGPRIGICSNQITVNQTKISASGRGCGAGKGLGAGKQQDFCAGSGGAHGGVGGYGGSESSSLEEKAKCKGQFPKPYHWGFDARLEGSGGGNGELRNGQ